MVEQLINDFEELKKYIFIITRKDKKSIIIKFRNENFYHLVGLHKIKNFDNYFPTNMKSKDKRYKYIKKNPQKFNNILKNQLQEKDLLKLRIATFSNVANMLRSQDISLYNLKPKLKDSLYDGDYGLMKTYENDLCCLLGLKIDDENEKVIKCIPNSWMASRRINKLVEFKRPIYIESTIALQIELYDEESDEIIPAFSNI